MIIPNRLQSYLDDVYVVEGEAGIEGVRARCFQRLAFLNGLLAMDYFGEYVIERGTIEKLLDALNRYVPSPERTGGLEAGHEHAPYGGA